jgi:hypothetical protein
MKVQVPPPRYSGDKGGSDGEEGFEGGLFVGINGVIEVENELFKFCCLDGKNRKGQWEELLGTASKERGRRSNNARSGGHVERPGSGIGE